MAEMAPEVLPGPGAADGERYARSFPDLYRVATAGEPAFKHLVQARVLTRSTDRGDVAAGGWLADRLQERFGEQHGGAVEKDFYCTHTTGGCLLAADRTVHSILNDAPLPLVGAEVECKVMAREARYGFAGTRLRPQLEEATDHAYSALTRVMGAADEFANPASTDERKTQAVTTAVEEVAAAKRRVETLLQRQSRFEYFQGVLAGALPTIVLTALVGVAANIWWDRVLDPAELTGATTMAAFGAVISVIQRMSSGSLVVDHTASSSQRRLLGSLRPLVGAIFGAVAYFAILTGLIASGTGNGQRSASFAFFAFVGFSAGFSERFATDMLERAGRLLGEDAAPPAPPTAPAQPPR
ncbi:MAG TPA: hypothetical protein VF519_06175 [Mycobacteriales bacterium]|jgi:hypothetical protein